MALQTASHTTCEAGEASSDAPDSSTDGQSAAAAAIVSDDERIGGVAEGSSSKESGTAEESESSTTSVENDEEGGEEEEEEEEGEVEESASIEVDLQGPIGKGKGCCGSNKITKYGVTKSRLRFLKHKHKYIELGSSPIMSIMLAQSIPAFISFLCISLYSVVDSIYVGRGVGEVGLTGMGIYGPIDMGVTFNIAFLPSYGAVALATAALGMKNFKLAESYLTYYIVMSFICCCVIMICLIPSMKPLLRALGAEGEVLEMAYPYGIILSVNSLTLAMNNGLGPFMRLENKPIDAMVRLIVNAALNIIIDPILIFAGHLELKGAALATLISGTLIASYFITWYCRPKSSATLHINLKYIKPGRCRRNDVGKILLLGIGPTIQNIFIALITLFVNRQIIKYSYGDSSMSNAAISGYGVSNRIYGLLVSCVMGISQAAMPIFGFNTSAKQSVRSYNSLVGAIFWIILVTVIIEVLIIGLADYIVLAFGSGDQFVKETSLILRIVMPTTVCDTMGFFVSNYFVLIQKKVLSMLCGVSKAVLFIILIYTLPLGMEDKYTAIWISAPISNILSLGVILGTFLPHLLKLKKEAKAQGPADQMYTFKTLVKCTDCRKTKEEKERVISLVLAAEKKAIIMSMNENINQKIDEVAIEASSSEKSEESNENNESTSSNSNSSSNSNTSPDN